MKILYFTATGNNLYLAKRIGGELYSIPQLIKAEDYVFNDDKIGLVFPIYGLSVPAYIEEFLQKATLNSDYIFAVMSYGMHDGGAPNHLLEIADKYGIKFSYINTIEMVDNYLPTYYMEEQKSDEPKKRIEKCLDEIIDDINVSRQWIVKTSSYDKVLTKKFLDENTHRGEGVAKLFKVDDKCTKCGICVKVCPTNNVCLQEKPQFGSHCISCLACTHNCPQNAIRLESEKSKERFRNQHITLKEIVDANR